MTKLDMINRAIEQTDELRSRTAGRDKLGAQALGEVREDLDDLLATLTDLKAAEAEPQALRAMEGIIDALGPAVTPPRTEIVRRHGRIMDGAECDACGAKWEPCSLLKNPRGPWQCHHAADCPKVVGA